MAVLSDGQFLMYTTDGRWRFDRTPTSRMLMSEMSTAEKTEPFLPEKYCSEEYEARSSTPEQQKETQKRSARRHMR